MNVDKKANNKRRLNNKNYIKEPERFEDIVNTTIPNEISEISRVDMDSSSIMPHILQSKSITCHHLKCVTSQHLQSSSNSHHPSKYTYIYIYNN